MNSIQQVVFDHLPRQKRSPSGWYSFNAVCCHHNGEGIDKRSRGGVITDGEGISYHCFNCGFKSGWRPGRHISYKFRKLLDWLGVEENERQRLVVEALRIKETVVLEDDDDLEPEFTIEFPDRKLPEGCVPLADAPQEIQDYAQARCMPGDELLWSNTRPGRMYRRIIIPCTWNGRVIGSTARGIDDDARPKYFNNYEANYVYGIDRQVEGGKFSIVCEGIIDAMTIGGIATLTNRCNETQAQIIDTVGREIVLVPDRDRAGQALIDDALEYGWSVSFPEWEPDVKDVNAAVVRYGKLFTLKSIIDAKQTSRLKINLMRKKLG
jgi:hypothetical protein